MLESQDPPEIQKALGLASFEWRVIGASVRGPSHEKDNSNREDAFALKIIAGVAIAVVSDGAGTAKYAAAGAGNFSKSVLQSLADYACNSIQTLDGFKAAIVSGVEIVRQELLEQGHKLADYHATLISLYAMSDRTFIAHVGDGLAGVAALGNWETATLSMPRNGEYANETFFVTEDEWIRNLRCLEVSPLRRGGAAVALTDGAEHFVITPDSSGLSAEFMEPVSRFLASCDLDQAANALAGTLNSKDARKISSDDKTLIWIGANEQ
jgi:hypothetical protein